MKKYIVVFLFVLITFRFLPLFQGKTLFFGDNYSLMVPGKIFTASWLRQGVVPLWNPYIFAGVPWAGNINESIFYISTPLFALLHPSVALNITVLLHIFITGLGMYMLGVLWTGRKAFGICAAALWMFSPQVTGSINNLTTLQSIAWLPWVMYAGVRIAQHKKGVVLLAVIVSLQIFGGYPQYIIYSLIGAFFLCFLWLFQEKTLRKSVVYVLLGWCLAGIITLGVTAIAWLPFLDYLLSSTRTVQTQAQSTVGSLHPAELVKAVVPYFFDMPQIGMKWGPHWNAMPNTMYYVTVLGLLVATMSLFTRTKRSMHMGMLCFIVFSTAFAMGESLPGYTLIQRSIPLFSASRGPSLILVATNAILCLWVASSLSVISIPTKLYRILVRGSLVMALGFLLLHLVLPVSFTSLWKTVDSSLGGKLSASAFHTLERDEVIVRTIVWSVGINLFLLSLALGLWKGKRWVLLCLVLSIDMHINTSGLLFYAPRTIYPSWSEITNTVRGPIVSRIGSERALISNFNTPYTDFGAYWEALTIRAPFSDSYIDEKEMKEYAHLHRMRETITPDWNMVYRVRAITGYVSLLPKDVDLVWNTTGTPAINNLPPIAVSDPKISQWGIRYYLLDTWFPEREQSPTSTPIFDSGTLLMYALPSLSRIRFEGSNPPAIATVTEDPNTIEVTMQPSSGSQVLVIADRFDADWRAYADGVSVAITNHAGLRHVTLPTGSARLTLRYQPMRFYAGALTTSVTIIGLLLYGHRRTIRNVLRRS